LSSYALEGFVENAEHGDGVTLIGGWVRMPPDAAAAKQTRLRLSTPNGLHLEWPLNRLLPRRDLPPQGDAPAGRGFQLLIQGLPEWQDAELTIHFPGGEIQLQPRLVSPTPFRPRGHLDGADGQEAWGWLVHAPGAEAAIVMEGVGAFPIQCDVHRSDLPFDDGQALPAFGFHVSFAGTPFAEIAGPRLIRLVSGGAILGEATINSDPSAATRPSDAASAALAATPAASAVSTLLVAPAPAPEPALVGKPRSAPGDILLAVDCCQMLGNGHVLVTGWLAWPDNTPAPFLTLAPRDPSSAPPTVVLFDRPDLAPMARADRALRGFIMVAERMASPAPNSPIALRVRTATHAASFALPGDKYGPTPDTALQSANWAAVFDLLAASAAGGPAEALLATEFGAAGAFTRWLAGVPRLQGTTGDPSVLRRIEALASLSGECALGITLAATGAEEAQLRLIALVAERGQVRPLRVTALTPLRGEATVTVYGALLDVPDLPAAPFELLLELRRGSDRHWFRLTPRMLSAPAFLDGLHHLAAAPDGTDLAEVLAWLAGILEHRMLSFSALLAVEQRLGAAVERPLTLVLRGFDDPFAPRLLAMAATEIERHADAVLLLGPRHLTRLGADLLLRRGKIKAHAASDLREALRTSMSEAVSVGAREEGSIVILDIAELGEALTTDGLAPLLQDRLPAAALAILVRLATIAGLADGADAVDRLTRLMRNDPTAFSFGRADTAGASLVAAHLCQLWWAARPLFLPEDPDADT
jgi:hypothetical protein